MKIVEVDYIPETVQHTTIERNKIVNVIEEFLYRSDARFVRVDYEDGDYHYATVCRSAFASAIERRGYPVRVFLRNGKVYLAKAGYLK